MKENKIYDLSCLISEDLSVYEGDPKVKIKQICFPKEKNYGLFEICFGNHTGTHIGKKKRCSKG